MHPLRGPPRVLLLALTRHARIVRQQPHSLGRVALVLVLGAGARAGEQWQVAGGVGKRGWGEGQLCPLTIVCAVRNEGDKEAQRRAYEHVVPVVW